MASKVYFKVLRKDGKAVVTGAKWPLPTKNSRGKWVPGAWTKVRKNVKCCERGWHLSATMTNVITWLTYSHASDGPFIVYLAEPAPEAVRDAAHGKAAFSSARLLRPLLDEADTARFLAGYCRRDGNADRRIIVRMLNAALCPKKSKAKKAGG